jgi:hypothetical protein
MAGAGCLHCGCAGLAGIGYLSGFPDGLATMLGLLINVFFGLEGNNFRRRSLARRGYNEVADVVASDREEAAWRYFAAGSSQKAHKVHDESRNCRLWIGQSCGRLRSRLSERFHVWYQTSVPPLILSRHRNRLRG